jgi:hypothetical protein
VRQPYTEGPVMQIHDDFSRTPLARAGTGEAISDQLRAVVLALAWIFHRGDGQGCCKVVKRAFELGV